MSVIKNNRNVSTMEFMANARKLQTFTMRKAANFPKKYRFFISLKIADLAKDIYLNVQRGNSIYPTNAHEVQKRKDYFNDAKAAAFCLASQLEIANELFSVDKNDLKEWSRMISFEIQLIKAILDSDKARYKKIK